MDKRKTPVVRSNSTSEAKKNHCSEQEHKKTSRSSAEFQAKITVNSVYQPLKRRGVYVEKKTIKIPINIGGVRSPDARASSPRVLPHSIRRPHKKRFLANILTLLAKSTASTQCSAPNSNEDLTTEKRRQKIKKKREEQVMYDPVTSLTERRGARAGKTKNSNNHFDDEMDSLIVLQSTKEIIQTPSNNSEYIPLLNRKAASTHIEPEHIDLAAPYPPPDRQDLNTTPAKPTNSKRASLISSEERTGFEANRNEKDIYNFFVDILKTTLSTCNNKHHTDGGPLYTNSSNVSLVIDEVVVEKLKMQKVKDNESEAKIIENEPKAPYNELYMPPGKSKCYYSVMPYVTQEWGENFKPEFNKQCKGELTRKKQPIISNSIQYRSKPAGTSNRPMSVLNKPVYKATSMPEPAPKKIPIKLKVNNKRNFIHSLKQELFQTDVNEKPNFFQALQTIAKNKNKQSVKFRTYRRPSDDDVCKLRSRKVLSAKSSLKKKPKTPEKWQIAVVPNTHQPNFSPYNRQAPITIYETSSEESFNSNYSLEVTGYDDTVVKTYVPTHPRPVMREYTSPSFHYSDD